ncbi:MAG: phage holin family protein [Janthinobacterium lividum]
MARISLVQSVRQLMVGTIEQVSTRLHLLGLELAEERERVIALLIAALISCFFVFLAVIFGALFVVAAYWDTPHRMEAIGWLTGGAAIVAVLAVIFFVYRMKVPTALFSHSLAELDKDRHTLETLE